MPSLRVAARRTDEAPCPPGRARLALGLGGTATRRRVHRADGPRRRPPFLPTPRPRTRRARSPAPGEGGRGAIAEICATHSSAALWQRAGAAYGVPWQVLAAINKIESNFGRNMGPSSAGAVGWMQFMPVDVAPLGHGRRRRRHSGPLESDDAIYSRGALPRRGRRRDRHLAAQSSPTTTRTGTWTRFCSSRSCIRAGRRRRDAGYARPPQVSAPTQPRTGHGASWKLARAPRGRGTRRERAALLAPARQRAAPLRRPRSQARHAAAGRDAAALRGRVADLCAARPRRDRRSTVARAGAGASFAPAAGTLLAAPVYAGNYVFPVGGGPGAVCVGARPPRLSGGRYRGAARAHRSTRSPTPGRSGSRRRAACGIGLTMRPRRADVDVLPPAVPRRRRHRGRALAAGSAGRPRRLDRTLDRPAPPPPAQPADARTRRSRRGSSAFAGSAFRWQARPGAPARRAPAVVFAVPYSRRGHRTIGRPLHPVGGWSCARPVPAEGVSMGSPSLLPRVVAVAAGILLFARAQTITAGSGADGKKPQSKPETARGVVEPTRPRRARRPPARSFVFAKGMLEESGFGWQGAAGSVRRLRRPTASPTQSPTARCARHRHRLPRSRFSSPRNGGYPEQVGKSRRRLAVRRLRPGAS